MKAKYEQFGYRRENGKKLAITAIMRKLIVMANALLRDQRKLDAKPPALTITDTHTCKQVIVSKAWLVLTLF